MLRRSCCARPSRRARRGRARGAPATSRGCRDTSARSGEARLEASPTAASRARADLAGVDGVAEVVAGAVGDEGDQRRVRAAGGRGNLVQQRRRSRGRCRCCGARRCRRCCRSRRRRPRCQHDAERRARGPRRTASRARCRRRRRPAAACRRAR